jgi:hypothetical protein
MSRCWLDGELRAYLDGEMPPREIAAVREHLQECSPCSSLAAELAERAARIGALLVALEHAPAGPVPVQRESTVWGRRLVAAAALAAAACAAMLFLVPKHHPVTARHAGTVQRAASPPPAPALPSSPRPATQPHKPPQVKYYLALDDEPIESGVVVRVSLPDSGLLADVIYDEQGRPRAVRPLN